MKQFVLAVLATCFCFTIKAQRVIQVEEKNGEFSLGKENGFYVEIPDANVDDVMKEWKDLMKDYKAKSESKKDEMFSDDATMPAVSDNVVDVYAVFRETEEGMSLHVFLNLGGAFLNSHDHRQAADAATSIIRSFAVDMAKEAVEDQVELQEKILDDFEKDLKALEKENESLHKDIEEWKDLIKKAESDIKTNLTNQETKKDEIENQRNVLETVKKKLEGIK